MLSPLERERQAFIEKSQDMFGLPIDRNLYLDLMQKCLSGLIYEDEPCDPWSSGFDPNKRENGRDWPSVAHTMIGAKRLANLRWATEHVLRTGVPGDFVETGVWRGGACILMRAVLKAYGDPKGRCVWAADSFGGLPPITHPSDAGDVTTGRAYVQHQDYAQLAVSLDEVRRNFEKYGLLDSRVRFLKGWFKDTLPSSFIQQIAVLRLDGDMYQSTMDALKALYSKVSKGGVVIVDDYLLPQCRHAVHEFRTKNSVGDTIKDIDGMGAYWVKSR